VQDKRQRKRKPLPGTETVWFDGWPFHRRPGCRYFWGHRGKSLHRAVWEFHRGDIPEGMDIHHKDEDVDNNDISNLECLSRGDHNRAHNSFAEWNSRPEANELRKANVKRGWDNSPYKDRTCRHCGRTFQTRHFRPHTVNFCPGKPGCHYAFLNRKVEKPCSRCGTPYLGRVKSTCCVTCRATAGSRASLRLRSERPS
jgi:hypothetical protein